MNDEARDICSNQQPSHKLSSYLIFNRIPCFQPFYFHTLYPLLSSISFLQYFITMSKPNEQDSSSLVSLFKSIGLTQTKAADAVKAPKSANILKEIIESHAVVAGGLDEKKASLISTLAILLAKASTVGSDEREYVINCILCSKLKTVDQITGECSITIFP